MHNAAQRCRLRPGATLMLILLLSSLSSLAAFGQDAQTAEERSASEQIQDLVASLERRGAEIAELQKYA